MLSVGWGSCQSEAKRQKFKVKVDILTASGVKFYRTGALKDHPAKKHSAPAKSVHRVEKNPHISQSHIEGGSTTRQACVPSSRFEIRSLEQGTGNTDRAGTKYEKETGANGTRISKQPDT